MPRPTTSNPGRGRSSAPAMLGEAAASALCLPLTRGAAATLPVVTVRAASPRSSPLEREEACSELVDLDTGLLRPWHLTLDAVRMLQERGEGFQALLSCESGTNGA